MKQCVILTLFLLTGCVTSQYTAEKSVCESKPSWVEYAECSNRLGAKHYGGDPLENEMIAYRNLLIEKVRTKQITPKEAEYLRQQKWNQAKQQNASYTPHSTSSSLNSVIQKNNDQMIETLKNNRQNTVTTEPIHKSPKTTNCEPNGFGGIRCTTY